MCAGVFHDGSEADGLIAALFGNAELLRGVRVFVCHSCWGGWRKGDRRCRPHQQEPWSALRNVPFGAAVCITTDGSSESL